MDADSPKLVHRSSLGVLLLVFAALACFYTKDFGRTGLGDNNDPGARFFPLLLAGFLGVWGMVDLVRGVVVSRGGRGEVSSAVESEGPSEPAGYDWLSVLLMVFASSAYVVALPWLGFTCSTLVFSIGVMLWLGTRWWLTIVIAVAMAVLVRLLFVGLFKVQLPPGELGLPF
jgi:hypothetical protein